VVFKRNESVPEIKSLHRRFIPCATVGTEWQSVISGHNRFVSGAIEGSECKIPNDLPAPFAACCNGCNANSQSFANPLEYGEITDRNTKVVVIV
jgi:hypothetical protein